MKKNLKNMRRSRIRLRIRKKVSGTSERPRLSVYRSNRHIYAQLIDDVAGHTLAAVSTFAAGEAMGKPVEASNQIGKMLAEKAKAAGIEAVVFDRNGYRYHGRVKALAEGAREGGLQF
ncbi:MAG: 50S ribosomal protein L18 [Rhodothermales bacterium]